MRAFVRLALLLCACLASSQDTCSGTCPAPRALHVVTVATDAQNALLLRAVAHAAQRGVQVRVLEEAAGSLGHGVGFGLKLRRVSALLDALPAGDVLLFVDAYDVLVTGTPQQLLGAYDEALAAYGTANLVQGEYVNAEVKARAARLRTRLEGCQPRTPAASSHR